MCLVVHHEKEDEGGSEMEMGLDSFNSGGVLTALIEILVKVNFKSRTYFNYRNGIKIGFAH